LTADLSFDVVIIGGGQAGIPLAHALARAGRRVALAERRDLGGSCVNFGCTPTKAAIASARAAHVARRGATFGLRIPTVEVDFAAVLERAKSVVARLRHGLESSFSGSENPRLLVGHARFEGKERATFLLRVGGATVAAKDVVIDTGTRSEIPDIDGLDAIDPIHAGNWVDRKDLPEHIVFIGGSFVATEMAQFYRRMGSRVTVLEKGPRILAREDEDVAAAVQTLLKSEGIAFRTENLVERIEAKPDGVTLTVRATAGVWKLRASHVFVAAGRRPNTDDLGLETVGLRLAKDGTVPVNELLATRVRGIWAAGDVRGGPLFTHTSWDDFRILESQMLGDRSRTTDRIVPYAIFTDPELGRVGMTEREARASGADVRIGRFELWGNGKAREIGEIEGFVKLVVDGKSGRFLGAAVFAHEAAELVHIVVALMNAGAGADVLRDAIHIHPTLAEAVQGTAAALGPAAAPRKTAKRAKPH
jgi:pyruvate/2-oxoglutarate dehydrogenase complex dihydrolipoamide dehydrogenase (E3) component